jgi:aconitate hydratase
MTRGTFANIRLRNLLAPGTEGGFTRYLGKPGEFGEEVTTIFDAAMRYKELGIPLVVLAGKDYGMGSSRDWAAKGTMLLGVKAAIAESFERIHRSNLVGMGVLPLVFKRGQNRSSLGLTGMGTFDIEVPQDLKPCQDIKVHVTSKEGQPIDFLTTCRIDTPVEIEYYRNGGILQTVLRRLMKPR